MWMQTSPMIERSWWSPNHFVPYIPMPSDNMQSHSQHTTHTPHQTNHNTGFSSNVISSEHDATTSTNLKSSLKCADQQSPFKISMKKSTNYHSTKFNVIASVSTDKLQHCVHTSTQSSSIEIPPKPLPTVSSVFLLGRKNRLVSKERKW